MLHRSNFRPISVLAIISKILKRHAHSHFCTFLVEHELFTDLQFGFRWFRSCKLATLHLSDLLLANIDRGLLSGLLLVDLKKAFDLVDHDTLLIKLGMYGCCSSTLKWFRSYLTGRTQKTVFKGALSDPRPVSLGVTQGSILGHLFFLIFINDLPPYLIRSPDAHLTMFADDTTPLTSRPTVQEVEARLNQLSADMCRWANLNKIALNAAKTKSILVTTRQRLRHLQSPDLNVSVNGTVVEQVNSAKILGVLLDDHLTWDQHVDRLSKTLNSRLSLLRRISPFLDFPSSLLFHNSCIHSKLAYCSTVWGRAPGILFSAFCVARSELLASF